MNQVPTSRSRFAALCACASLASLAGPLSAQRGAVDIVLANQLDRPNVTWPAVGDALPPARGVGPLPTILLTGYWPPSNEAVRRFSTSPQQNPQGWIGADWEGRGYDVVSFFPEFTPPNCSSCGKGTGQLEVDYQDTSADWWQIVPAVKPIAIITASRGSIGTSWELEMNQFNRTSWLPDFVTPFQPTPSPPDETVPAGALRLSTLPVQAIRSRVNEAQLGTQSFICYSGNGGGFLSEFIAYHGVWYQNLHASPADPEWCAAAGHVHIGTSVPWNTAEQAMRISLRVLISYVDAVRASVVHQTNVGFGGPGSSVLAVAGEPLMTGSSADLLLYDAAARAPGVLVAGLGQSSLALFGGTLVPTPPILLASFTTSRRGRYSLAIPGGGGPASVFFQALYLDPSLAYGVGLSNTVSLSLLP